MSKIFGKDSSPSNRPARNTVDFSYSNHLTLKMGGLYPVMCKEVLPGDSVRLTTTFGLRFMPLYFPVQSRIRAYIHYFYVRSRNLWDDWPDFISNTKKNLVRPFIAGTTSQYNSMLATGKLADYLGVPTTVSGSYGRSLSVVKDNAITHAGCINTVNAKSGIRTVSISVPSTTPNDTYTSWFNLISSKELDLSQINTVKNPFVASNVVCNVGPVTDKIAQVELLFSNIKSILPEVPVPNSPLNLFLDVKLKNVVDPKGTIPLFGSISLASGSPSSFNHLINIPYGVYSTYSYSPDSLTASFRIPVSLPAEYVATAGDNDYFRVSLYMNSYIFMSPTGAPSDTKYYLGDASLELYSSFPKDINEFTSLRPYGIPNSDYNDRIPILAEPFRAYESIYNAFYRDERNNPFLINGEPEYQKFLPVTTGGADTYNYSLHYRNWEQDQFTTAVPSPQQGIAPLVGIESTGVASFVDPETDKTYRVQLTTSDDGDTVTGVEYLENIPKSVARSLVNVATSGISINTFRNVNSYQRWLETNIRKGFKYKDQIEGHYGVDVAYNVLDMPEFIGGVTEDIQVQQINQNSQSTDSSPLGSFAGQAYALGSSKNTVSKYFDEHGYLIGILCVAPVPSYSQVLPKMFLKNELLDIYFPEFGKIGYQPITYKELCPIQSIASGSDPAEVFGYQRPWYDYLSSIDEVHGDFRTSLRDFLINRVFDNKPVLGPDFTVMDPSQLNDIFSVTSDNDKILGQVYFDMQLKRPIPLSGIPSLE